MELVPRMGHCSPFDDAAIEEGFVAGVVVADELAGPVPQERLRMRANAGERARKSGPDRLKAFAPESIEASAS